MWYLVAMGNSARGGWVVGTFLPMPPPAGKRRAEQSHAHALASCFNSSRLLFRNNKNVPLIGKAPRRREALSSGRKLGCNLQWP